MRDFDSSRYLSQVPQYPSQLPRDILPHHTLIWARDASELKRLKRISSFEVSCHSKTSQKDGKSCTKLCPDILGLRAESEDGKIREIGNPGPVCAQDPSHNPLIERFGLPHSTTPTPWAEENMIHFDIDGAGGEYITEVHVVLEAKAIKLITNRGREAYFGEDLRDVGSWQWWVLRAGYDEVICGLMVCFGTLGGWDRDQKCYGHWKMDTVRVLTVNKGK
jgi:hypothetical protein